MRFIFLPQWVQTKHLDLLNLRSDSMPGNGTNERSFTLNHKESPKIFIIPRFPPV